MGRGTAGKRGSPAGGGQAFSDGNLSLPCIGPDGMDCKPSMGLSEEQQSEALWACHSFRPTNVSRPSMGLSEEQPDGALWACHSFRPTKESCLKKARASFSRQISVKWFEEQLLPGEMAGAAESRENGRASIVDEWFMEENARYSTLKPLAVCLWGGRVSLSSNFSGGGGRRGGCDGYGGKK